MTLKELLLAVEKVKPKKPIGDLHSVPHYRCPTCKNAVVVFENDRKTPCCYWCGQALDWAGKEEEERYVEIC
ncbi:MAG: hypothetical protein IJS45_11430 [Clostridia bacterium]|nr:hypothetical protein [Clostridia bacterium]